MRLMVQAYKQFFRMLGGTLKGRLQHPEWFSELKFVNARSLTNNDFTRGHGDVLKKLGVVKR
jgi:hypothetical protein